MAIYTPVILKGDYAGSGATSHERQERASLEGCICTVDFHFDTVDDSGASGGEVHYKEGNEDSRQFALAMWAELAATGLPPHGANPVLSTAQRSRSAFIERYEMPAILLEPLFLSNPNQAGLLHGPGADANNRKMAEAITAAIKGQFPRGGKIGLSPGHAYKTSSPNDPGGPCALGDTERAHILTIVGLVEQYLSS
jgi:N-acetylmuramoyl-L-alanine amidase